MPIQPVENQRLYRQIADQISGLIASGEFEQATRLPSERDLAVQLGVSRPLVREALIALEVEGKVDVRVGSGIYVARRRPAAAIDPDRQGQGPFELLRARWSIEGEIAAEAARTGTARDLARVRAAVDDLQRRQKQRRDMDPADRDFHLPSLKPATTALFSLSCVICGIRDEARSGSAWSTTSRRRSYGRPCCATIGRSSKRSKRAPACRAQLDTSHLERVNREFIRGWKALDKAESTHADDPRGGAETDRRASGVCSGRLTGRDRFSRSFATIVLPARPGHPAMARRLYAQVRRPAHRQSARTHRSRAGSAGSALPRSRHPADRSRSLRLPDALQPGRAAGIAGGAAPRRRRRSSSDSRKIWRLFADHWHLFRGTPSRLWFDHALHDVFGVRRAARRRLRGPHLRPDRGLPGAPEFRPRALFERFNIEVLATTDGAARPARRIIARSAPRAGRDASSPPSAPIRSSIPAFAGFADNVAQLGEITRERHPNLVGYLRRARQPARVTSRRLAPPPPITAIPPPPPSTCRPAECEALFAKALAGTATPAEAERFGARC